MDTHSAGNPSLNALVLQLGGPGGLKASMGSRKPAGRDTGQWGHEDTVNDQKVALLCTRDVQCFGGGRGWQQRGLVKGQTGVRAAGQATVTQGVALGLCLFWKMGVRTCSGGDGESGLR